MSNSIMLTQATKLASTFEVGGDARELIDTLKATVFKGNPSDAQMTALMLVAGNYKLNPFTREIFAFPDKNNGIVPVVSIDGWARIINDHAQFDGMEFIQDDDTCTCIIYRKDRNHPTKVTEWMAECRRNTQPWQSHPKRMLRHKSLIQCARIAFGFVGIYDQDEAERIIIEGEKVINPMSEKIVPVADLIEKINHMSELELTMENLKNLDIKPYNEAERKEIKQAIMLRRKTFEVVATVEPTVVDIDYLARLDDCLTQQALQSVYESIPLEIRGKYQEDFELKMDLLR